MPARRQKHPPTPWQTAKPFIENGLISALVPRGFTGPAPAMTLWRRRREFIDVMQLKSKYGTACNAYFGCHPTGVRETVPSEVHCMFRTSARKELKLPTDVALVPLFVDQELLPAITHIVDTWFPRFASLKNALSRLENETSEVCGFGKGSISYEQALVELEGCIERSSGG